MSIRHRHAEAEEGHLEEHYHSGFEASAFFRYVAYVLIIYGLLFILTEYGIPNW